MKFSVLGDSISTLKGTMPDDWRIHYEGEVHVDGIERPQDTWWGRVIDHFDGDLLRNSSYSGSVVEGFGFPAAISDKRISYLIGEDGETPDVVLIFMGINDYGWAGGRNQVMGGSVSASAKPEDLGEPYEVTDVADEGTLQRFEDAYALAIKKIHAVAPDAQVWCVNLAPGTVPNTDWPNFIYRIRGIELDDYNAAIARAAKAQGAHVADVRAFGLSYDSVDGTHPSALGMEQIACMVIAQMEGGSTDPTDYPLLANAPKSVRGCYEDNCAGCEFADIQKNRWSLYCSKYDPNKLCC